ncbi:V/A-type H+-transporting ATPase subunit I [Roseibium hamelinense]|uniref:V/A-type H+-transporting ATPase subunit I n=1 Tax=Roseibium hamelinense TaxID=150831 RepID=A0A562SXB0_9HYPH|nr:V-type ATPase 116kDa subunit family protein [Roseibium hamelinense]MTI44878.1 V-type ATP synthase subunit I [Roseibium hamelinense]TWI85927.1 V/A-type H+-transporting ATPase subunit I [Roseibium hamelinense]
MTIVPLKKVSLLGVLDDKHAVLETVQAFGNLHLIPLSSAQKELEAVPSPTGQDAVNALRWLMDCPEQRRPVTRSEDFNTEAFVEKTLRNRIMIRETEDRIAWLQKRIASVKPWGEFSFAALQDVGDYRLWFYIVPKTKLGLIDPGKVTFETVHEDRYRAHVVVLSPDEPPSDAMPVPRSHIGEKSLSELQRELEDTEVVLEGLELDRRLLTAWRVLLAENLAAARDNSARQRAALETADDERVFVLQGWARADQLYEVEALAEDLGIAVYSEDPSESDAPPTLLENPARLAAGEDLVEFYQTPGYRDWDPSIIVYISFVLFFGMIMTDAGYGLILLGVLFLYRKRFQRSATSQRLLKMAMWLMASTAFFGVITGSYFGISPPPDSLLGYLKIMNLKEIETMMKLNITIGVSHIVLANTARCLHMTSWHERIQPIGWSIVALGGLATYLGNGTPVAHAGPIAIVLGLLAIGFFASNRPVNSLSSAGMRVFDGFAALARIVNMFSDILSYMRLFALGLAAASLAETINSLSGQLMHAVPGIGLLVALFVLVIGHAINIGLGIIAGCVHGLRLNVIEFFNWALTDEGKPFRPFKKEETGL